MNGIKFILIYMQGNKHKIIGGSFSREGVKRLIDSMPVYSRVNVACVEYDDELNYESRLYSFYSYVMRGKRNKSENKIVYDEHLSRKIRLMFSNDDDGLLLAIDEATCSGKFLDIDYSDVKQDMNFLKQLIKQLR